MPNKKTIFVKPREFVIRIAQCGTNSCISGYDKITGDDALDLLFKVNVLVSSGFVGEKHGRELMYSLGIEILDEFLKDDLKKKTVEELLNDHDNKKWTIKNLLTIEKI